jgi:hypothetical protein
MAIKGKAKTRKRTAPKDLTAKDGKAVKGGRKAGGNQQEYMTVKMSDVLITGV